MPTICCRELRRQWELEGSQAVVGHVGEALRRGDLRPEDFSLRDLAEALIPEGRHWLQRLDPRRGEAIPILEAEGVDVTAFLQVTGQVVQAKILEGYRHEAFTASRLVSVIPTRLDGERIPGASRLPDAAAEVHPGMPYPHVGFGEDYIETPRTTKRGLIVPVTREAIFFDRTHVVLSRAAEVGEILGRNREKRILDTILGAVSSYKHNGTAYDTYYAAGGGGPWVNLLTDNPLIDWTSVDRAEQLFAAMTDPGSGEPVLMRPNTVLVPSPLRHTARRIFAAQQVTFDSGGGTATASPNPLADYRVHESRLLLSRITAAGIAADQAKTWWFLGDFARAFAYMENWPITVTQSPAGSEADFNQDIVVRFKASERGTPAVLEPRAVVRCSAL